MPRSRLCSMVSGRPLRTVTVRPCASDTSQLAPLAPAWRARSSTACASSRSSASSQVKPGCFGMARYDTEVQDNGVSPSPPSKTQRKKQMLELQELGSQLVELPEAQVAAMGLDPALEQAVTEAKRMKSHEAKRRQLQYIGRLM